MKKKEADPNIKEDLIAIMKKLGGKAMLASQSNSLYLVRRPCGIFSIDLATSGGLAAGTLAEISGPEGSGKNYLANQYIRKVQSNYGEASRVFIAVTEYVYDKLFARACGVSVALSDVEIDMLEEASGCKFLAGERKAMKTQVGEVLLIEGLSSEDTLQAVLDCLKEGCFHIGVIDSIGALVPLIEAEKDVGDKMKVACRASLQTEFMDKFYFSMGALKRTLLLALNQVRVQIGAYSPKGKMGPTYKPPEACAIKHGLAARIELSPGARIFASTNDRIPIGKTIRWEITKGKIGFHEGARGELLYNYEKGIDLFDDFINVAILFAVRSGAYYSFPALTGDEKFQGRDEFYTYFQEHPDKVEEAKRIIMQTKGVAYKWVE